MCIKYKPNKSNEWVICSGYFGNTPVLNDLTPAFSVTCIVPWVPEGFFRSEAAIVSGEAASPAKREKKTPLDAAVTNLTSMRF